MSTKIRVASLLDLPIFQQATHFTTPEGLENELQSVNIMDVSDIDNWLMGAELLIIGKFMTSHFTKTFIESLKHHRVGAIVSKKKYRPYLSDDKIDLLRYYQIPLFLIDNHHSWSDVIIAFQEAEIAHSTKSLIESEHFIKQVIHYFSDTHSINNLCQIVYETTNLSTAILSKQIALIDASDDWSWEAYFEQFSPDNIGRFSPIGVDLNQQAIEGFCYRSLFLTKLNCHLFFLPCYQQNHLQFYLVLRTDAKTEWLEATVLSKLANIQSIYLLKAVLETEFQKNTNYFKNIIFDDMLKMTKPDLDSLSKYSLSLGKNIQQDLQILLVSDLLENSDVLAFETLFNDLVNYLQTSSLATHNLHFFSRNQQLIVLFGPDADLLSHLDEWTRLMRTFLGHHHFYLGISSVKPYWQLRRALDEAKQAIRFSKSNQQSHHLQFYQDIGILKLLTDDYGAVNHLFVAELFEQFLHPLLQYDQKNHTQLYPTVTVFFDNHFSYTKTSQKLYIHVNTLRARLAKVESILAISLKNTDQLMNLHLALRLYQHQLLHTTSQN
ncbi:helix-turn-helix domain-containing protein [Streptococcus halichoeri]|uniref:helix-turn-helix domain-containing protein n=1 Tax=Streptococcus halichoeri TaxID=254785 RepID=UPI001F1B80F9|nr:helix-turn-helix domain-containing protein [Streptococcus halichoeri]